jgi:hypothetical protein
LSIATLITLTRQKHFVCILCNRILFGIQRHIVIHRKTELMKHDIWRRSMLAGWDCKSKYKLQRNESTVHLQYCKKFWKLCKILKYQNYFFKSFFVTGILLQFPKKKLSICRDWAMLLWVFFPISTIKII